jgi:hypothetical protein
MFFSFCYFLHLSFSLFSFLLSKKIEKITLFRNCFFHFKMSGLRNQVAEKNLQYPVMDKCPGKTTYIPGRAWRQYVPLYSLGITHGNEKGYCQQCFDTCYEGGKRKEDDDSIGVWMYMESTGGFSCDCQYHYLHSIGHGFTCPLCLITKQKYEDRQCSNCQKETINSLCDSCSFHQKSCNVCGEKIKIGAEYAPEVFKVYRESFHQTEINFQKTLEEVKDPLYPPPTSIHDRQSPENRLRDVISDGLFNVMEGTYYKIRNALRVLEIDSTLRALYRE